MLGVQDVGRNLVVVEIGKVVSEADVPSAQSPWSSEASATGASASTPASLGFVYIAGFGFRDHGITAPGIGDELAVGSFFWAHGFDTFFFWFAHATGSCSRDQRFATSDTGVGYSAVSGS